MCRFVAYLGQAPIFLSQILEAPENSLIHQSSSARQASCTNADGFGVAWYNHPIDETPGLFKSIQPAWNDFNLTHLAHKISSHCVLGHVRASTVGDVSNNNCHPFAYEKLSFEHNGTIRHFEKLRRKLLASLNDASFNLIHGNTDSEHFFALVVAQLPPTNGNWTVEQLAEAFVKSISLIEQWQRELGDDVANNGSHINSVLTDGYSLLASRYTSVPLREPLSLYYIHGESIAEALNLRLNSKKAPFVLVASEPLGGHEQQWQKIPDNHLLLVRPDLSLTLRKIEISTHAK